MKIGKVRFCLNVDVRKEKKDSWLRVMKTKIAFVKVRLNFSSKSTTIAINILPWQSVCIWGFLRVLVSNLLLNRVTNPRRSKDTLVSKELHTAFHKFEGAARVQKRSFRKWRVKMKLKISIFFINCSV